MLALAEALIKRHEGYRADPYRCTAGKLTIGFGRNLEDVGIYRDEAELMLANDLRKVHADLQTFWWFGALSENRQAALMDMRYQLGAAGFRGFKNMIAALEVGDYAMAAGAAMDSKWAKQDTPSRASEIAEIILQG